MTDIVFNDLLKQEVENTARFYADETHYEAHAFMHVAVEIEPGVIITKDHLLNPGEEKDLAAFFRKTGCRYAMAHENDKPLALFLAQPTLAIPIGKEGQPVAPAVPKKAMTIYGVTNDGRNNLAVLEAEHDEDSRLYLVPIELHNYQEKKTFDFSVVPFTEFFSSIDQYRTALKERQEEKR